MDVGTKKVGGGKKFFFSKRLSKVDIVISFTSFFSVRSFACSFVCLFVCRFPFVSHSKCNFYIYITVFLYFSEIYIIVVKSWDQSHFFKQLNVLNNKTAVYYRSLNLRKPLEKKNLFFNI